MSERDHVRCPYCVEDGNFRIMVPQTMPDTFLCTNCGHLALPAHVLFQCTCKKCALLYDRDYKHRFKEPSSGFAV